MAVAINRRARLPLPKAAHLPLLPIMSNVLTSSSVSEMTAGVAGSWLEEVATLAESTHDRPSWDDYFMGVALLLATRSTCDRLHVGCVLVTGGTQAHRIIAAGYNGHLPGAPHESRVRDGHEQATVHAEQNAIADAARRGVALDGATAYVSHFPCLNCAKILAAAGIKLIKYHHNYRNDPLVPELLAEIGVTLSEH